jgi:hypothetical protein
MTSIALCIVAFIAVIVAAGRSTVAALIAVLAVGYAYGIVRANVPEAPAHLMFDAAVIAFYLHYFSVNRAPAAGSVQALGHWTAALIVWPSLLFLLPMQDWLIQLVGLRANVFLLPMMIIGARLSPGERDRLALGLAVLNLLAFGVAVVEFVYGVDTFFPSGPVTRIVYASNDLAGGEFRIPASFANAHAYGGTMAATLPLIFGAWMQPASTTWRRVLLPVSLVATLLGIFMTGARLPVVLAFVVVIVGFFSTGSRTGRLAWVVILVVVAWGVSSDERLQRFTTLSDSEAVTARLGWSVNLSFVEVANDYPLGNGLGGGGSSIPYFLEDRLPAELITVENEYARMIMEIGLPGLALWIAFVLWAFSNPSRTQPPSWKLAHRLAWVFSAASFLIAVLGTGLFTAIPGTCLLLLNIGWIVADDGTVPRSETKPTTRLRTVLARRFRP